MKRALAAFAAIGLVLVAQAHAGTTVAEVIVLQHRTAEEVIPLLEPFIGQEGAIAGVSGQLIIRATPENLADIKEILREIDTAPRRLLITVRQNVTRDQLEGELAASGRVTIGDHGRVVVHGGGRASGTGTLQQAGDTQRLQVLEGSQAFIQAGTSVPYPERSVAGGGTTYRDVTSGFYVLPRLRGDYVILEINPRWATVGEQGRANIEEALTRVSARLGEWIELGGIARETSEKETRIGSASSRTGADRRGIFVKVEEMK